MAQLGTVLVTGGAGFIGCALLDRARRGGRSLGRRGQPPPAGARDRRAPGGAARGGRAGRRRRDRRRDLGPGAGRLRPDVVVHLAAETGTAQSLSESSPSRAGQRRRHDPAARRLRPVRSPAGARRADQQPSRLRRGHLAARRRDAVPARRAHPRPARGRAVGLPRQRARPQLRARPTTPGAVERLRRHQARAGARARRRGPARTTSRCRCCGSRTSTAPGQSLTNPYTGIVSLFSQLARDGASIPLYEDGEITRDFVYIDDVADALVAAAREHRRAPAAAPSTWARASAPPSGTSRPTIAGVPRRTRART